MIGLTDHPEGRIEHLILQSATEHPEVAHAPGLVRRPRRNPTGSVPSSFADARHRAPPLVGCWRRS
jgi:hypothetical protein